MLLPFAPDLANQGARSVGPSDWLREETLTQSSANQNLLELPGKPCIRICPRAVAGPRVRRLLFRTWICNVRKACSCRGPSLHQTEKICFKTKPTESC